MGSIIGWLVGRQILGRTITERWARFIAHAALFLLILAVLGTAVCALRKDAVADHEAKIEQRAKPATDKAANERAKDAIENAKQDQERHDVIEAQPDQPISPTSRALSCKRLHDAGRNPPACR